MDNRPSLGARRRSALSRIDRGNRRLGHAPLACLTVRSPRLYVLCLCQRPTDKQWAVTVERLGGERERQISPVCGRCNYYLGVSADNGVRLKSSGERWYPGHVYGGVFKAEMAPWIKDPKWRG